MEIKLSAKYIKTAPRKVKAVCDLIKDKGLYESINQLKFLKKQAAQDILKLLNSAYAVAQQKELVPEKLYIKEIRCNQGPVMKRTLIRSRGRATQIKKRMSHITIIVSESIEQNKLGKAE